MLGTRYLSLLIMLLQVSFSAIAADYVVPSGKTILTETQLLDQAVGNTFANERWSEYWEPPTDNPKKGRLRGKLRGSEYSGNWEVKNEQICMEYDSAAMAEYNTCYTITLVEDNATWYFPDGSTYYPRGGRIKMSQGNPQNH